MNFNLPLSSYQKDIAAVRSLVDVCASPTRNVKLVFTSSIAVAGRWDPREGPVPERVLSRAELASTTGYAASKYAAEKVGIYVPTYLSCLMRLVRFSRWQHGTRSL